MPTTRSPVPLASTPSPDADVPALVDRWSPSYRRAFPRSRAGLAARSPSGRPVRTKDFHNPGVMLDLLGLTPVQLACVIVRTEEAFAAIDASLAGMGMPVLSEMSELANTSALLGAFFQQSLGMAMGDSHSQNKPNAYPDMLSNDLLRPNFEVKVALEGNKPKGHLAKAGMYLTLRYVLIHPDGHYDRDVRGCIPAIWEIRLGALEAGDFRESSTAGDSGKTAVISARGLRSMPALYFCETLCPTGVVLSPDQLELA